MQLISKQEAQDILRKYARQRDALQGAYDKAREAHINYLECARAMFFFGGAVLGVCMNANPFAIYLALLAFVVAAIIAYKQLKKWDAAILKTDRVIKLHEHD